jgi:hypothetical protein
MGCGISDKILNIGGNATRLKTKTKSGAKKRPKIERYLKRKHYLCQHIAIVSYLGLNLKANANTEKKIKPFTKELGA